MPEHYRKDGQPKRGYLSRKSAKQAAKKWHDVYQCSECGLWHLASKRNKKTPRRRDRTSLRGAGR